MIRKLNNLQAVVLVAALQDLTKQHDIEHTRLAHGMEIMLSGEAFYSQSAESWMCTSTTRPNRFYAVDLQNEMCSCPDCTHRGAYCKHLVACWLAWRVGDILTKAQTIKLEPNQLEWLNPTPTLSASAV